MVNFYDSKINREHGIPELQTALSQKLSFICDPFLEEIRRRKPRYIRDQFRLLDTLINAHGMPAVIRAITYCQAQELFGATDVKDALDYFAKREKVEQPVASQPIKPITNHTAVSVITQKRSIDAYSGLGGEAI